MATATVQRLHVRRDSPSSIAQKSYTIAPTMAASFPSYKTPSASSSHFQSPLADDSDDDGGDIPQLSALAQMLLENDDDFGNLPAGSSPRTGGSNPRTDGSKSLYLGSSQNSSSA